jgi:hypothetical protein
MPLFFVCVAFDGVIWYKFMIQKLKNIATETLCRH